MEIEKYLHVNNRKFFNPIFEKWHELIERYIENCPTLDNPWWYNERVSIGILASAVYCLGGIALEEYVTVKNDKEAMKKKKGRCDLYFKFNSEEYNCEAKQVFCYLDSNYPKYTNIANKKVNQYLDEAIKDANKLNEKECDRLAICFAVPFFEKSKENSEMDTEGIDKILKEWCEQISKIEDCVAFATYFPKEFRYNMVYNGDLYPGVTILIKKL